MWKREILKERENETNQNKRLLALYRCAIIYNYMSQYNEDEKAVLYGTKSNF